MGTKCANKSRHASQKPGGDINRHRDLLDQQMPSGVSS
jgi:hypothetical protein